MSRHVRYTRRTKNGGGGGGLVPRRRCTAALTAIRFVSACDSAHSRSGSSPRCSASGSAFWWRSRCHCMRVRCMTECWRRVQPCRLPHRRTPPVRRCMSRCSMRRNRMMPRRPTTHPGTRHISVSVSDAAQGRRHFHCHRHLKSICAQWSRRCKSHASPAVTCSSAQRDSRSSCRSRTGRPRRHACQAEHITPRVNMSSSMFTRRTPLAGRWHHACNVVRPARLPRDRACSLRAPVHRTTLDADVHALLPTYVFPCGDRLPAGVLRSTFLS